jgi:hypothetical protein
LQPLPCSSHVGVPALPAGVVSDWGLGTGVGAVYAGLAWGRDARERVRRRMCEWTGLQQMGFTHIPIQGPPFLLFVFLPFPSLPVRLGCSRVRLFPSRRSGDPSRHHSDERLGSPFFLPFDPACWSSTASMSVSPVSRLTLPHRTDRPSRVLFQDLTSHPPSSVEPYGCKGGGPTKTSHGHTQIDANLPAIGRRE